MKIIVFWVLVQSILVASIDAQFFYFPFDLENYSKEMELRNNYKANNIKKIIVYDYRPNKCHNPDIKKCPTVTNCATIRIYFLDENGFENKIQLNNNTFQYFKYNNEKLPESICQKQNKHTILEKKYIYNGSNKLTKSVSMPVYGDTVTTFYEYNLSNELIHIYDNDSSDYSSETFFESDSLIKKTISILYYKNDTANKSVRIDKFNELKQLVFSKYVSYNFERSKEYSNETTISYDDRGRILTKKDIDGSGFMKNKTYYYFQNGLLDRIKEDHFNLDKSFAFCHWTLYRYE